MTKKIWGTREKSSPFIKKKIRFFSGAPNFFGPSYFEAALGEGCNFRRTDFLVNWRTKVCMFLRKKVVIGLSSLCNTS